MPPNNTHQQTSSKELIDKFFDDQNNIWKSETGLTIAECKEAEKELLQSLLTSHSEAIRERVEGMRPEVLQIVEKGSEHTSPREYRTLGYARAVDDILALLTDDKNI